MESVIRTRSGCNTACHQSANRGRAKPLLVAKQPPALADVDFVTEQGWSGFQHDPEIEPEAGLADILHIIADTFACGFR